MNERFLRSLGILTPEQLGKLKNTKIGVAGLGMGGSIFINLVRMGVGSFHIADPDIYERTNINRQRLANERNLARRKDDCLIDEARAINPEVKIRAFREGVSESNVEQFLEGVDLVVDVVDIYAMNEKIALNTTAALRGIPVITSACYGFGATYYFVRPGDPSFPELLGLAPGMSRAEQVDRFCRYMAPEVPRYMREQLSLAVQGKGHVPFIVTGVEFAAAAIATEITKHIAGLGESVHSPHGVYIDPVDLRFEVFESQGLVFKPRRHLRRVA